jgi:hypothetical protein
MSVGGASPTQRLALGLSVSPPSARRERIVGGLVQIASDATVLADYRADVLIALHYVALHGIDMSVEALRNLDAKDARRALGSASGEFIRAMGVVIASIVAPRPGDPSMLMGLARKNDARIRDVTVDAAGALLSRNINQPLVESIVLGSLYDPSQVVLQSGLRALARIRSPPIAVAPTVVERMLELYSSGSRAIRRATCGLANTWVAKGLHDERLDRLLALGRRDRSWTVRDAATNAATV